MHDSVATNKYMMNVVFRAFITYTTQQLQPAVMQHSEDVWYIFQGP